MTQEEIQLKLSLDGSQYATGLRQMESRTREAGDHVEKSFIHAQSSARGFHKVLEQLNETIPGLGSALSAITSLANPVTAAFIAGAAAISYARERFKEFNEEMDKQGAEAAKPMWSEEAFDRLKEKIEESDRAYHKFLESLHPSKAEAAVEAISGEKDPNVRNKQAYAAQQKLTAERDAALEERKRLQEQSHFLEAVASKSPGLIKSAEQMAEGAKKLELFKTGVASQQGLFFAGQAPQVRDTEEEERRQQMADELLRKAKDRQRKAAEALRHNQDRSRELERMIPEKQKAIGELGKIQADVLWPEWAEEGKSGISGSSTFSARMNLEQNKIPFNSGNAAQNTKALGDLLRLHEEWDKSGLPIQPRNGN